MKTKIVFTGPAVDRHDNPVLRADLKALAERKGYEVQTSVRGDTEILVASRFDTLKARGAMERGVRVLSYPAFIDKLGGTVPKAGNKPNRYTDTIDVLGDDPDAL